MKVVHIPFSTRNPYQKLLSDVLKAGGISVEGEKIQHVQDISFLNLSLFTLLYHHWKPDIVHLHWQSAFLHVACSRFKTILKSSIFLLQLRVLKILGIKLVWTVHNLKRHETTFRDLEARFTVKLAKQADRIIVHCQSARDEIMYRFGSNLEEKIVVIGHGNFSGYYPNTIDRETARKHLNLPSSRLTFLFLGELRYYKGIIELVDTFIAMDDDNLQLLVAGRPHNKKIAGEIQMMTSGHKNIQLHLQYVPEDSIQDYINAADVMVFPYRDIFTSGGIFLGLTFGKTMVAPATGCIADTLAGSSNFLYDPQRKNGLLQALETAAALASQKDTIRQENLTLSARYDWDRIGKKTAALYNSLR